MPFVQAAQNTTNSGSSVTVTLSAATTVGNCLIVLISQEGSAAETVSGITIGGVADNFAQTVTPASTTGPPYTTVNVWTDQDCQQASTSVVVTLSGSTAFAVQVIEWHGIVSSSALDKSSTNTDSTGSASWTSNATPAQSATTDIAFGIGACDSNATSITGPATLWTNQSSQSYGSFETGLSVTGYQALSSTAAVTYAGTLDQSDAWAAAVITLKTGNSITVSLPLLEINSAAFALKPPIYVDLPLLRINSVDFAVTPSIPVIVDLPLLTINSNALPLIPDIVPVPPKLIIALASVAGTDQFGNNYPQGVTEFEDQTHYANLLSGVLAFVANNLAGGILAHVLTQNTPGLLDLTSGGVNAGDTEAEMFMVSRDANGGTSQWVATADEAQLNANTQISGTLFVSGTGQFNGDLTVNGNSTNLGDGTSCFLTFNPRIPTPPNLAAVIAQTASLAQTQACLGAMIQSLRTTGMVN